MFNVIKLKYGVYFALVALLLGAQGSSWASNYWPLVARSSSAYSTYYSPDPTEQGSILYTDRINKEVAITSGYGFSNNLEWRVFVPPGTKTIDIFMFTFSAPEETKVTARFGSPPVGTIDAVNVTNGSLGASQVLPKLLSGEEVVFYGPVFTNVVNGISYQSSGGGTRLLARPDYLPYVPTTKGGWIYFKTWRVPGQTIQGIDVTIKAEETCYKSWFANTKFDSSGNPAEDVEHTCAGSGVPAVPVVALQGIALSPSSSLAKGTFNTLSIAPVPANASLPTCVATDAAGLTSSQVTVSGTTVSLKPNAPAISSNQTVTITCGQVRTTLTVIPEVVIPALTGIEFSSAYLLNNSTETVTISAKPDGAVLPTCAANLTAPLSNILFPNPYIKVEGNQISVTAKANELTQNRIFDIECGGFKASLTIGTPIQVVEVVEADGTLTLKFKLQPLTSELGKATKVWIAARLPATSFFVTTDTWFFRTNADWKTLILPNLDFYVFKTFTAVGASEDLVVPLGLPKDLMQYYGLDIYMGYQTTAGQFKNVGRIWK